MLPLGGAGKWIPVIAPRCVRSNPEAIETCCRRGRKVEGNRVVVGGASSDHVKRKSRLARYAKDDDDDNRLNLTLNGT